MDDQPDTSPFGVAGDGAHARVVTLDNGTGLSATVMDVGATLVSLRAPDRDGQVDDVVLGYDDVSGYESPENPYVGATIGRVANRIAYASFVLDGRPVELTANEPPHHLHGGGARSFDKVRWAIESSTPDAVTLRYVAPDGEEGYPGRLDVRASYRLDGDALVVSYRARTDRPTAVNLTTHPYWNLGGAGRGDVLEHEVEVAADRSTPTDETLAPTGAIDEVAGTPLDLRGPVALGQRVDELRATPAGGFDHNYVLRGWAEGASDGPADAHAGDAGPAQAFAARVRDPRSGRVLEVRTDQPGLQLYSGQQIPAGLPGRGGASYGPFVGLCLEPQGFPDAVHHPHFPSVVLRPGEVYRHESRYRLCTDSSAPGAR